MSCDDPMNRKTQDNSAFQGMRWVTGSACLLLLISVGLEVFAQQTFRTSSVATIILELFLAFWSYVLGIGLVLFVSVRWLVEWQRVRRKRAAMSRCSIAEPKSRGPEKPEQEGRQFRERDVAPVAPNPASRENEDGNKINSQTRVA